MCVAASGYGRSRHSHRHPPGRHGRHHGPTRACGWRPLGGRSRALTPMQGLLDDQLNIALADTMAMTLAEVGEEAAASVRKGLEPAPDHPSTRLNVGTHMLLAELQGLEFDSLVGGLAFDDLQDLIHRHVVERLREAARWPEDFKHL